ncbi:patched family-domain-containing protein [Dunaliella salina]|nr:patched family-domain-containing protein [Dunaliella salina]KAF5835346.1 patched family-domain-containing protein [Dunaliella salina]|eukprot:KAF5835344.1 patched family-domain-containing protein [Dunaliella salina]
MLASIQGSLLVLAMVVLSDVGLFGFMHFAGLNLNSVTFIILVIAVGIAVDFSGHVCRAFLVEQGTRKERAEKALYHIGGEVMNGAFSTWLAVIVLAGANHYIFHSFFMMLFALVVLAIWHGIIFLPVCLHIVGRQATESRQMWPTWALRTVALATPP